MLLLSSYKYADREEKVTSVRRKNLPCRAIGVGMGFSVERDRPRVTTTGGQDQRNAGATACHKDPAVAFDEPMVDERGPGKNVGRQRIDTRLVENNVRLEEKSSGQDLIKGLPKVLSVWLLRF